MSIYLGPFSYVPRYIEEQLSSVGFVMIDRSEGLQKWQMERRDGNVSHLTVVFSAKKKWTTIETEEALLEEIDHAFLYIVYDGEILDHGRELVYVDGQHLKLFPIVPKPAEVNMHELPRVRHSLYHGDSLLTCEVYNVDGVTELAAIGG